MSKATLITAAVTSLLFSSTALAGGYGSGCSMKKAGYMQPVHPAAQGHAMRYQKAGYSPLDGYGQAGYKQPTAQRAAYGKEAKADKTPDIVDTAVAAGSFSTLVAAVQEAGLVDTLKGDGPFTVFAPTDAAFAKLPAGMLEALLQDKAKLTQILTYHVVPARLDSAAVKGVASLATVAGSALPVADIKISQTDIQTSNGVIHVIDEVLIPQS